METHDIHGTKINIHDDSKHMLDFLKKGMHHEQFNNYLKTAQDHGETHIIDPSGHKFTIEHSNGEFSIRKSHYNL